MAYQSAMILDDLIKTHAIVDDRDVVRLRSLSPEERGAMIKSVCEAAATIQRSRLAAGLPVAEPAPWPASTWEFLKKNAACVRT
jgi:hypothetical protein